jgi:hypothetical protein
MRFSLLLLLFLSACTSNEKNKKGNVIAEKIFRKEGDLLYRTRAPEPKEREEYPWEKKYLGKYPRITKEFFRCKGNASNPPLEVKQGENKVIYRDCRGTEHHGLPMRDGKEFIYPCLVNLLNYLQEKTEKKVVITCGHRCPDHNTYCDSSPSNYGSKHMIGAEVDFYVEGMEKEPQKVIALIQDYYKGQKEYEKFERYDKNLNVSTKAWLNKEIFIKLYLENEGRDHDNQHPYPYIGLQVRFDRDLNKKVTFEAKETRKYLRN